MNQINRFHLEENNKYIMWSSGYCYTCNCIIRHKTFLNKCLTFSQKITWLLHSSLMKWEMLYSLTKYTVTYWLGIIIVSMHFGWEAWKIEIFRYTYNDDYHKWLLCIINIGSNHSFTIISTICIIWRYRSWMFNYSKCEYTQ